MKFLLTPFPRPKSSRKNILLVIAIGLICSVFILVFKPFNIENQEGQWYVYFIIFSLGIVFSLSILLIEFLLPKLIPKLFLNWNLGKAILWYSLLLLAVAAIMFLYKSYLGGFTEFSWIEYIFVLGRVLGIGITVVFFTLGCVSYINRKQFSLLASNENYSIQTPNGTSVNLNVNDILFIVSDDNYVDIHLKSGMERKKEVFRSSLKNVESQIVNPVSPIYRCHRKYLINIQYFKVQSKNSRNMSILLKEFDDVIPVSKQYADQIFKLLQTRP